MSIAFKSNSPARRADGNCGPVGRKQRRFEDEYEESPLVHKQTCDDCPEHKANDYFKASVTL
jgi:hypothetical protein